MLKTNSRQFCPREMRINGLQNHSSQARQIKHHEFDRITVDPVGMPKPYSAEVEHLAERGGDAGHDRIAEVRERAFDQAPIVDRAKLIDEQVGDLAKRGLRGHADAQGLGIVDEISG